MGKGSVIPISAPPIGITGKLLGTRELTDPRKTSYYGFIDTNITDNYDLLVVTLGGDAELDYEQELSIQFGTSSAMPEDTVFTYSINYIEAYQEFVVPTRGFIFHQIEQSLNTETINVRWSNRTKETGYPTELCIVKSSSSFEYINLTQKVYGYNFTT